MEPEEITGGDELEFHPQPEAPVVQSTQDHAEPQVAPREPWEETIEAWFIEHFHNLGPRLETSLFNHFTEAKARLIAELKAIL